MMADMIAQQQVQPDLAAQAVDDGYIQHLQTQEDAPLMQQALQEMRAQQAGSAATPAASNAAGDAPGSKPLSRGDMSMPPVESAGTQAADRSVAQDISLGVMQAPREIGRGLVKGYNEMGAIADQVNGMLKLPVFQLVDKQGIFSPDVLSADTADKKVKSGENSMLELPNLDAPKASTVTGQGIESIAQFLSGFGMMGKALKAVVPASKLGKAAKLAVQGAGGDVLAFDEQQGRLSNLVQSVPALQNPVTEYLQAKPDDSFAEGKFKQAVEGLGLGVATEGIIQGVKVLRTMHAEAIDGAGKKLILPADTTQGMDAKAFDLLGDVNNESLLLTRPKQAEKPAAGAAAEDPLKAKVAAAGEETSGISAKEVAAAGGRGKDPLDDIQINYARINTPEDVKNTMQALANDARLKESVQQARRGTRSNAETKAAAESIDGFDDLMQRRSGQVFNAEQVVAARTIYADATKQLRAAALKASGPTASAVDQFNFQKMIAVHQAVQKEVLGARAEQGRGLQAWSIPVGGDGKAMTQAVEQTLLEHGGQAVSRDLAQKIAAAGDMLTNEQLNGIVQKSVGVRTLKAVEDIWTNGLLTGPVTWSVNIGSNFYTMFSSGAERAVMGALPGSETKSTEALWLWAGMLKSQGEALANAARAWRSGESGYYGVGKVEMPYERASAVTSTMPNNPANGQVWAGLKRGSLDELKAAGPIYPFAVGMDWFGKGVQAMGGRVMTASDEYAKTVLYRGQLKALAFRQAAGEGLEGDALTKRAYDIAENPSEGMKADALDFARENTFTRDLGKTGQKVMELRASTPYGRFIVPFAKTPANIFKYTYARTPLAPLSANVRRELNAGGTRAAAMQAKIGLGTSILMLGLDQALQGKLTGAGPVDPAMRAAMRDQGWKPYSIKIGDSYHPIRMEPLATLLGNAADIAEITSNYEAYDIRQQDDVDKLITAAAIISANQVSSKTYLSGMADTFEMLSDPGRYGEKYVQRYAGSIVPSGIASLERVVDPQKEYVTNTVDAIKARLPGNGVTKKFDVWGRPDQYFYPDKVGLGSAGERVGRLFDPFYGNKTRKEPIITWLGQQGEYIFMPNKVQKIGKQDVNLDDFPGAYMRLVELRGNTELGGMHGGKTMLEFLNAMVEHEVAGSRKLYNPNKTPEDKVNEVKAQVDLYQKAAMKKLIEERPELLPEKKAPVDTTPITDKPLP